MTINSVKKPEVEQPVVKKEYESKAHKIMNTSANSFRWEKDHSTNQLVDFKPNHNYNKVKVGLAIGGGAILAQQVAETLAVLEGPEVAGLSQTTINNLEAAISNIPPDLMF